jgi:two-component system, chemotaxis family, chemotaxis protein CheY
MHKEGRLHRKHSLSSRRASFEIHRPNSVAVPVEGNELRVRSLTGAGQIMMSVDGSAFCSVAASGTSMSTLPPVLIVDDDASLVNLMRHFLLDAGYDVESAPNGAVGLESVQRSRPGLVILDMMMPVMDGAHFLRVARASPDLSDIPVLVCSADEDACHLAERLGADACLEKPVDMTLLLATVAETYHSHR